MTLELEEVVKKEGSKKYIYRSTTQGNENIGLVVTKYDYEEARFTGVSEVHPVIFDDDGEYSIVEVEESSTQLKQNTENNQVADQDMIDPFNGIFPIMPGMYTGKLGREPITEDELAESVAKELESLIRGAMKELGIDLPREDDDEERY